MTDFPVTADFVESCNPGQLHDEARGAKQTWPASFVRKDGQWVYEVQRDDVDRAAVQQALDDHVPVWPADPDEQIAAAIRAVRDHADTRADVKGLCDALLGEGGGARVVAHRVQPPKP